MTHPAPRTKLRLVEATRLDAGTSTGASMGEPQARTPEPPPVSRPMPAPSRTALSGLPDAQLVALACDGEGAALEALYRRHAPFAINLATRIEGSSRDVEDIVHDAFIRAFEKLPDLSDRAAFRGWLGSIVVHGVRSRMRRARFLRFVGLGRSQDPVDLDAIASSDASPHVRAQIAQIYALLRLVAADDRIAWTLRMVESHDLETVARMTECSLATVKRRIARAQAFLEEHFVDHAPQGASEGDGPESVREEPPR